MRLIELKDLTVLRFIMTDMGLGKTFTGAEKLIQLGADVNLVVCQKSKVQDWLEHFKTYYGGYIFDLTNPKEFAAFEIQVSTYNSGLSKKVYPTGNPTVIAVINYDLMFRRKFLQELHNFTLMLDESSMIQNDTAKRTKAILKLDAKNVILLSGTPVGGKYENLYTQLKLLGWNITKTAYWDRYIKYRMESFGGCFPFKVVTGYKNITELKEKLKSLGADFLTTNEVFDLPQQNFNKVLVPATTSYKQFRKDKIITIDGKEYVGDNPLKNLLYSRMLCGQFNKAKLAAFKDLVDSTDGRLIVFYNFNDELTALRSMIKDRKTSVINGTNKDLTAYNSFDDSITFVQYQAGAMGLNLQKANHVIYFTLPLSSELYEQSKKRIHRIGQTQPCFYYNLICKNTVEEHILATLEKRKDYTAELFRKDGFE